MHWHQTKKKYEQHPKAWTKALIAPFSHSCQLEWRDLDLRPWKLFWYFGPTRHPLCEKYRLATQQTLWRL